MDTALRKKSKDWLVRNQKNVSEWGNTSARGLLFWWATRVRQNKADIILISSNVTCSRHDIEDETHDNIIVFDCMEPTIYHDQVNQELLTLPEHLSSTPTFNGVRVTWSSVLCVMFCRSLFVLFFSFGHCVVCASSIYGFWLPLW